MFSLCQVSPFFRFWLKLFLDIWMKESGKSKWKHGFKLNPHTPHYLLSTVWSDVDYCNINIDWCRHFARLTVKSYKTDMLNTVKYNTTPVWGQSLSLDVTYTWSCQIIYPPYISVGNPLLSDSQATGLIFCSSDSLSELYWSYICRNKIKHKPILSVGQTTLTLQWTNDQMITINEVIICQILGNQNLHKTFPSSGLNNILGSIVHNCFVNWVFC